MGSVLYLLTICLTMTIPSGDLSDDHHQFLYSHAYAPHPVGFHDIYPPGHTVPGEVSSTTDEDIRLNTISTQFVEFHPQIPNIHPTTPPPRVQNTSYDKNYIDDSPLNSSSTTLSTREPYEIPIKVIPVKHHQRGVLDLLLPASRVRTFKNVFDTFRRMLSYTFKRR